MQSPGLAPGLLFVPPTLPVRRLFSCSFCAVNQSAAIRRRVWNGGQELRLVLIERAAKRESQIMRG
jgi:hypothetical protein